MANVSIFYQENLQFGCYKSDPISGIHECAGQGYFVSLSITDVRLSSDADQFFFDPTRIAWSFAGPGQGEVGPPLSEVEHYSNLFLAPSEGFTFQGSGEAPMLIVRRIDDSSPDPGTFTPISYFNIQGDKVSMFRQNAEPIPTIQVADPSDFG